MSLAAIADTYLAALAAREPDEVPLTSDVRRTVNGGPATVGAADLRRAIRHEPPLQIAPARRWVIGDDELAVFYHLTAEVESGSLIPVTVGERFAFSDGQISEIEAVHTTTSGVPVNWTDSTAAGTGDAGVDAAVRAYLDALVSHRADDVPLSADVRRVENGQVTGDGSVALRSSLESDVMQMVQGVSDERWLIAGDSAAVLYTLAAGSRGEEMTVLIAERFRVRAGALTEIEAVFAVPSERE